MGGGRRCPGLSRLDAVAILPFASAPKTTLDGSSALKLMPVTNESSEACLSVVIPAYNEAATLSSIVQKVLAIPHLLEIIIVDDNSNDGTAEVGQRLAGEHAKVRVVRHAKNLGKTEALKTGFAETRGEVVIVQDADLEYDPAEIAGVIKPILDGHADVVYGSRFLVRKATRV